MSIESREREDWPESEVAGRGQGRKGETAVGHVIQAEADADEVQVMAASSLMGSVLAQWPRVRAGALCGGMGSRGETTRHSRCPCGAQRLWRWGRVGELRHV